MASAKINNIEIINNRTQLSIDVETVVGYLITSVKLWNIDTFKNNELSIDLNYKLEQTDNTESFIVNATELNITSFKDIWFIEIKTNYIGTQGCITCQDPALGVVYDLQDYYKCMLNYLIETDKNLDCASSDIYVNNLKIPVSLLITSIEKSIEIGYYSQSIEMLKNLKKLCNISKCKNCNIVSCSSCSKFIQQ